MAERKTFKHKKHVPGGTPTIVTDTKWDPGIVQEILSYDGTYNIRLNAVNKGLKEFAVGLRQLKQALSKDIEKILFPAAEALVRLKADAISPQNVPGLVLEDGEKSNTALARAAETIKEKVLASKPQMVGTNVVAILSRKELDTIKLITGASGKRYAGILSDPKMRSAAEADALARGASIKGGGSTFERKTHSPYNKAWMILEFGTGRLAKPRKRVMDDGRLTKVTGGGGAWKWGPFKRYYGNRVGPTIIGQEGIHFLYPARYNVEQYRLEREQVYRTIYRQIIRILRKEA